MLVGEVFTAGESCLGFPSALSHLEILLQERSDGKPCHNEVTEHSFLTACQLSKGRGGEWKMTREWFFTATILLVPRGS